MALQDRVEVEVENLLESGNMFTAYDVTKSVRKTTKSNVDHYDVQKYVHQYMDEIMDGWDYTRSNHTFLKNGMPTTVILYHNVNELNLNNYNPNAVSGPKKKVPLTPKSVKTVNTVPATKGSVVRKVMSGRLTIPTFMIDKLGMEAGDTAFISKSTQQGLLLVTKVAWKHPVVAKLMVDSKGNIRISRRILNKVGYKGNTFTVRSDKDHVVVE